MKLLEWVSGEKYNNLWHYILTIILNGFWIRVFSLFLLLIGMWILIKRRNIQSSIIFILGSIFLTYILGLIKFLFKG